MNVKMQSVTICCLLLAGFLLSACRPGELVVPTITPTPTSNLIQTPAPTQTSTLTNTPIPTPDLRITNPQNQHLYIYVEKAKTWDGANGYCQSLGGNLVSIESASENDFVYKLSGGNSWLGASDEAQEGTWAWISEQPFDFKYWDEGEPNNCCPSQNCGKEGCTPEHYLTFSGHGTTWNDVPNDPLTFVCEWESLSP